jgi:hypothetical protein
MQHHRGDTAPVMVWNSLLHIRQSGDGRLVDRPHYEGGWVAMSCSYDPSEASVIKRYDACYITDLPWAIALSREALG